MQRRMSHERIIAEIGDFICHERSFVVSDGEEVRTQVIVNTITKVIGDMDFKGQRALICDNGRLLFEVNAIKDGYYTDTPLKIGDFYFVVRGANYNEYKHIYQREKIKTTELSPAITEKVYDLMKRLLEEERGSKDPSFVF